MLLHLALINADLLHRGLLGELLDDVLDLERVLQAELEQKRRVGVLQVLRILYQSVDFLLQVVHQGPGRVHHLGNVGQVRGELAEVVQELLLIRRYFLVHLAHLLDGLLSASVVVSNNEGNERAVI